MKLLNRLFKGSANGSPVPEAAGGLSIQYVGAEAEAVNQVLVAVDAHNARREHARALACIDRLLTHHPDNAELRAARGATLYEWGRGREALAEFRRCAARGASDLTLPYKLGWTCLIVGEPRDALRWMRMAAESQPSSRTHFGLAIALQANGLGDEAVENFRKAFEENRFDFAVVIQYGLCRLDRKELSEAESLFRRAIDLQPKSPVAWTNLGVALSRQRRRSEALAALRHADHLETSSGESANNFVNLAVELSDDGRLDEALAVYERHLPNNPLLAPHLGYAGALLRAGRMEEGWRQYDYRLMQELPASLRARHEKPAWSGQDLSGRTILVEAEQGYGDSIQFARYAPFLKARGAVVLVLMPPALARLARSFAGIDRVITTEEALPAHDFHVYLLSLPRMFGTVLETMPRDTPYLRVDERRTATWRHRLQAGQRINVGLVWAGNPKHTRDEYRSVELDAFAPLGRVEGVRFVSLRKGDPGIWGSDPPPGLDLADFSDELDDFMDTAALISALDLVISVDTAVLHLAGALAKPTWALLTAPPDFRWMDTGETTPWYPTMRLFRQRRRDDWGEVIERVSSALAEVAVSRQFRPSAAGAADVDAQAATIAPQGRSAALSCARSSGDEVRPRLFVAGETRYGMMQYRPHDIPIGMSLDMYGEYLQPALDLLEQFLRPGMTVIEYGAGIGAHSVPVASIVGAAGHLMLYEDDALSRRVLQQNLGVAGATNVTLMQVAHMTDTLDTLGLHDLDLFKANGVRHGRVFEGAIETLRRLRPAVFLESPAVASLGGVPSQLEALGYDVRPMTIPLYSSTNFRGRCVDAFEGRHTFLIFALPRERVHA